MMSILGPQGSFQGTGIYYEMTFQLTLTGADEWTETDLLAMTGQDIEFGLLYSKSNTDNRYPSYVTLLRLMDQLPNPALHVCGTEARAEMLKRSPRFLSLSGRVQRIQVNGLVTLTELERLLELYPWHVIITQHREGNEFLAASSHQRHSILVDGSGGRGLLPRKWEQPDTTRPLGFAGGLNPENLRRHLSQLKDLRAHGGSFWVADGDLWPAGDICLWREMKV